MVFFRKKIQWDISTKILLKFYEIVKTFKQKSITLMHYYAVGGLILYTFHIVFPSYNKIVVLYTPFSNKNWHFM